MRPFSIMLADRQIRPYPVAHSRVCCVAQRLLTGAKTKSIQSRKKRESYARRSGPTSSASIGPEHLLPDELFNVTNDPGETVNLVEDPDHAAVAAELSARIDVYFSNYIKPEADLWRGGQPIQNSMMQPYWRDIWGQNWRPVFAYED